MNRRQFIQGAAGLAAAASLERVGAQVPPPPAVRTVRTNVLEIGYHESGEAAGFPVILLHGFPDDAHAYDGVAPLLAKAGYRALAVYLRGYGPTRFLDSAAPRTAEQAAIGQDVIDFADALKMRQVRRGRIRLGRPSGVRRVGAPSRTCASGGSRRRLYDSEHGHASAPGGAGGGAQALVSVVLQHRGRACRARTEPPRPVRADVARVVADLALHQRHVQPHGGVIRQS